MPPSRERVVSSPRDHADPGTAPAALAAPTARADAVADARRRRPTSRAPAALGSIRTAARGEIHDLLVAAVDEAARLLDADGAMVYLVDPATGHLRFAHDAGIRSRRSRAWVRSIDLPVGVGHVRPRGRRAGGRADRRLPRRPGLRPTPRTPTGSSATSASARWSWRRWSPATRCIGALGTFSSRAGRLQPGPDRARPGAGRPCRRRDEQRPAHRGARRARAASSPSGPTSSGRCARSGRGSAPPATCRRSSS